MNKLTTVLILVAIFFGAYTAFAGNTGKIAGTVRDKQTGEFLAGANIIINGTNLGATTDESGNYYILRVPPGNYELEARYIGYHTKRVTNVTVHADFTTKINFAMESTLIEFPTLEITAEQELVQADMTATRRTVSRQEIKDTPGMEQTLDIFRLQAGAVLTGAPQALMLGDGTRLQVRDESLKDVHIRGGRGGEILYMVDGVPVTHPIYGGRNVLDLNVVDVEEMELITGAFNAEYGQAQSGVVNITTRSGGDNFKGGIEYKTDNLKALGESYDTDYTSFYLGGPEAVTAKLLPALGLAIPGKMNFFISGNTDLTDTPYDNRRSRETLNVLGLEIREKQENTGNFNAKLNWDLNANFGLTFSFHGSWKRWSQFDWSWRNYPDHTALYERDNRNFNLRLNHVLSKSTFYTLNFGSLIVKYAGSLNGANPASFWTFYKDGNEYDYQTFSNTFTDPPDSIRSSIKAPVPEPITQFYDAFGYESIWRDDYTRTVTFKGDITSQIHPEHLIKTGIEVKYNDLQYIDIQDGGVKLSNYGDYKYRKYDYFAPPPGPFKEFGQNRWVFNAFPIIGGSYIQDKFEKETIILNAGLRFDWFMPGESVMKTDWKQAWEAATGLKSDWKRFKYKISPRFGISFPISQTTVVFFSYGHFNQLPELQYYYRDPYSGSFTGNPHLTYEQTILYEFGFTQQIAQNWAIDIKSYTKDISQQVETTKLRAALGLPVELHDNKGYARARGLEFELRKRYANFTSGKITYTVQWANGYSSSAFENYIRSINDFPLPIRERPLDWDIRHQIIFQGSIDVPEKKHFTVLGLKLPDNWNITILSRFATGQPYTPGTTDPAEAQKKENSKTSPSTWSTDIKINKTFNISGVKVSLFADVFNIFDHKNVNIYWGFNNWTGKPYKYGDLIAPTKQYYDWYTMFRMMDPRAFLTGRNAKIGLRIDW